MKKIKILTSILSFSILTGSVSVIASCNKEPEIVPTKIYINQESFEMEVGQTKQLTVTVVPETAKPTLIWESSECSTAEVDGTGLVTANATGDTTIKVSVKGHTDIFAECSASVFAVPTSVAITEGESLELLENKQQQLHAQVGPEGAKQTVKWSSSNSWVAEVDPDDGTVTAWPPLFLGNKATITATVVGHDNLKASCVVTVYSQPITVTIKEGTSLTLTKDDKTQLHAVVGPEYAKQDVTWSSSDETKVSVDTQGNIKANAVTETPVTITATAVGFEKVKGTCAITVAPVPTSVTITEGESLRLRAEDKTQLHAVVGPEGAKQDVIWSSSDETKVSVDAQGNIKANAITEEPVAIIAAVAGHPDITTSCAITVTEKIERINFNTCSWADVSAACNNLENGTWLDDDFFARFSIDGDLETEGIQEEPVDSFDDFVGQIRSLMINGYDHQARVIGCKQDFMDSAKTKPTIFTFQSVHLLSSDDGNQMNATYSTQFNNSNYWTSYLPKTLNSTGDDGHWADGHGTEIDEKRTVWKMISQSNEGIDFKNVYRTVNTGKTGSWTATTQQAKIFIPSLANFFCPAALAAYKTQGSLYTNEGQQYQYYANEIGEGEVGDDVIVYPCFQYKDFQDSTSYSWIASPDIDSTNTVHDVLPDGTIHTQVTKESQAVVPCFCI